MPTLIELRDERAKLVNEMNSMTTVCGQEKREFSAEENEKFEKIDKDQSKLRTIITNLEKTETLTNELQSVTSTGIGREQTVTQAFIKPSERQLNAYRSYLLNGENHMGASELSDLRALGSAAAGSATPTAGGYAAPAQVTSEFVQMLRDLSGVRGAPCRFFPTTSGNDIPFPTVDDTSNEGEFVYENPASPIDDSNDPTFGQKVLKSYAYTSDAVRISKQLLIDSVIPIESIINEELANRIAVKINKAYTTGSGTGEPEGIAVGAGSSSVSIDASDWNTNAAGYIYKKMQAIAHAVGPQYRKGASFGVMFTDNTLLALKQAVDGNGRPLWTASMSATEPDRVAGMPYYLNPDLSDIGDTHASVGPVIVGDFSKFIVRDVLSLETIRLNETYARYLQVGFLAWFRTDSKVVNSNALKEILSVA